MKQRHFLLGSGLVLIAAVLSGCATGPSGPDTAGAGMYKNPGDQAFHYRQQAAELRDMARRLELEAEWYATVAKDEERANRSRGMARDFRATAEEADQRATEAQSRLPHNQVY
ncbi:MAG TPA: hypothetical protein VFL31_06835 [Nitrospiraceae bacterium]|nr:hypothetical protein [Nitrospiraceae bacterium]